MAGKTGPRRQAGGRKGTMSIADEIAKLEQLRKSGALSAEEFRQAKTLLLAGRTAAGESAETPEPENPSLGRAANRYVTFQIISGVAGMVVVLVFLLAMCSRADQDRHGQFLFKHAAPAPVRFNP